ncbi:hypothetical protein TWF694_000654 [Orbilia ellipsospora]|uniref:Uncharacterized protein n=1 Tax=Orbilia ellipsospora TaxID=2528407 RepID=A0AAV9XR08_9PEZI
MRQLSPSIRRVYCMTRTATVLPRTTILPATSSYRNRYYSATTEHARPKIHDTAGQFEGDPAQVEKHNRAFGQRGENQSTNPQPRIHNAAGVFEGEERDVMEHNRAFSERGEGKPVGRMDSGGAMEQVRGGVFALEERDVMDHNREVSERRA